MDAKTKKLLPLIAMFIVFSGAITSSKSLLAKWGIVYDVLIIANLLFFLITLFSFFRQQKALKNSNPNVFVRNVMGGMLLKMFLFIVAIIAYKFIAGSNMSKVSVFAAMFLYLFYLVAEVAVITKLNKQKMPKQEAPLQQLKQYLPEGSFDEVSQYLEQYKVQLTITRERKSVLGDYRNSFADKNHRISVNGNLNPYAFLITLLHELAHLFTYEQFGNRVQAHGREWKNEYSKVLARFLLKKIFPADIQKTLLKTLQNPAASSCADTSLLRVLHQYDSKKEGVSLVEALPPGAVFKIKGGREFRKDEKVRKRFRCIEISTGKIYLFSPVYEVFVDK